MLGFFVKLILVEVIASLFKIFANEGTKFKNKTKTKIIEIKNIKYFFLNLKS